MDPLLDQLLPLRAVRAVVAAADRRVARPHSGRHRFQLPLPERDDVRVRPPAVDHPDLFAHREPVDDRARRQRDLARNDLPAVVTHDSGRVVEVRRTLLDVRGERRGDLGRDPLAFLVVLDVLEASDDARELRHPAHLPDAIERRQVQHAVGRDALQVGRPHERSGLERVLFEHPERHRPPPAVALDSLTNPVAIVIVDRDHVGLEQLQRVRYARAVIEQRHVAEQLLREALAIANPGRDHQALGSRPVQAVRDLRRPAPVAPGFGQGRRIGDVHLAGDVARLGLDCDPLRADRVVDQRAQDPARDVVIALQVAHLGSQRHRRRGDELVGRLVVAPELAQPRRFRRLVAREQLTRVQPPQPGDRADPRHDLVNRVH